ncbi:MAG: hypothetical protein IPP74_09770 [Alphaproteobacteria bacterium]|nr:hypothetical protein [Alphaproteobacteria bacterium]
MLLMGDPLPWFNGNLLTGQPFSLQKLGGRFVVMFFLGALRDAKSRRIIDYINQSELWKSQALAPVFISCDRRDSLWSTSTELDDHLFCVADFDGNMSARMGATDGEFDPVSQQPLSYRRFCVVSDPFLRVLHLISLADPDACVSTLESLLKAEVQAKTKQEKIALSAPILLLPRVLESRLRFGLSASHQGQEQAAKMILTGLRFRTRDAVDREFPVRDEHLREQIKKILAKRVFNEMNKCFHFKVTHLEHVVTEKCSEHNPVIRQRDNTTSANAHRQFGLIANISEDGTAPLGVSFPEFGNLLYQIEPGAVLVYSSSLLYTPVVEEPNSAMMLRLYMFDEHGAHVKRRFHQHIGAEFV